MTDEIWKPIAGWNGFYEVSDHGRVRSLDRMIPDKRLGKRRWKGRILKPSAGTSYMPYLIITLQRGGRRGNPKAEIKMPYVHILVLEAFVGPRPDGLVACHNDGDPSNNRANNLRWDTQSANQADSIKHGTHAGNRFKRLTDGEKAEIRRRKAEGQSSLVVAEKVGCCRHTVDRVWRSTTIY
ncbi:MAG: NUMOD4 motif-containing HNH endonuclease [Pseudomonadales bacterium]